MDHLNHLPMLKHKLMKTNRIMRRLSASLIASAAALLCLPDFAEAQPSPVGDWDFTLHGQRRGTAQVTFFSDFTLAGYQISTIPPVKKPSVDSRTGTIGDVDVNPRTGQLDGDGSTISGILNNTNIVGESLIDGIWSFDVSGRVIGSFNETVSMSEGGTNRIVTNPYSFHATVNPGRSLGLKAEGPAAKVSWQGRPTVLLRDLSGSYYANSVQNGLKYLEFFTLSPTASPNIYDVLGSGPDYTYTGTALYVRQGNFSMVTGTDGTNTVVRSVTGLLRTATPPPHGMLSGQATGVEGNVQFKINQ
jgi:hypothetical protein